MNKIRQMFQMLEHGRSQRSISKELKMGRNIIAKYHQLALHTNLTFRKLLESSDEQLQELLFSKCTISKTSRYEDLQSMLPHFTEELKKPNTTVLLLWEEYISQNPNGYQYTQFKKYLNIKTEHISVPMHLEWSPGEEMQVDFAGDLLYLTNYTTGERFGCPVLVCTLPYSSLVFAIALMNAKQASFYDGLNACLAYFGGVTQSIKSDNMTQWVKKSDRYEPAINETTIQWGSHNNTVLMATRVAKPRDKANVESHVNIIYKRIYARLRNEIFYSIESLNERIIELIDDLNSRKMQGRSYSRMERFIKEEKAHLSPLPLDSFRLKYRKEFTVNCTYHVQIAEDRHFYSVPYQYVGRKALLVYTQTEVEIYVDFNRIAAHKRKFTEGGYSTLPEHMPERHKAYLKSKEYNADYYQRKAGEIGVETLTIVKRILASKIFVQQSYRSCQGILALIRKYPQERIEAACKRANSVDSVSYTQIKTILEKKLDQVVNENDKSNTPIIPMHDNIRGAESYQ